MTEIPKCPTCGRRPSQGTNASIRFYGAEGCDIEEEGCPDPIHDIADQGPALKAERDEARAEVEHQKLRGDRLAERADRVMAERDEARELVLKLFRRGCIVERAPDRYDHMYSATYQEAQAALIAWGMVKREECVRE